MAKHSQAFIEVVTRFYVPLGHDLKDLEDINLSDLFNQGKVEVYRQEPKSKGVRRANSKRS